MDNPFEKFGIKHLSPSSLNTWRECPGLWALKYLGKMRDEVGPAAWRGTAVEKGLLSWLIRKDEGHALKEAMLVFEADAQGLADDKTDKERELIAPMLSMAIKESAKWPAKFLGAQTRLEYSFDGVAVPVLGYADFILENGQIVDLKTTKALPSEPRPEHARQIALYSAAKNAPASLMYVTGKKSATYLVGDNQKADLLASMRRDALSLQAFLLMQESELTAIRSLPMQTDSFRWSEAATAKMQEYAL